MLKGEWKLRAKYQKLININKLINVFAAINREHKWMTILFYSINVSFYEPYFVCIKKGLLPFREGSG